MIEPAYNMPAQAAPETAAKKHFRMRPCDDDRMAGSIPVWESGTTAKQAAEDRLAAAGGSGVRTPDAALAYTGQRAQPEPEEFTFGDLIDMVNPLQHIPVVGHIYRGITGDTIKPVAQIIGGGIYGGVAGAAGGIVNTIVEYETGKDIAGNVMSMVTGGHKPGYRTVPDEPEQRLNDASRMVESSPLSALPGGTLSFVDLGSSYRAVREQVPEAGGRTAGHYERTRMEIIPPPREPITRVKFSYND